MRSGGAACSLLREPRGKRPRDRASPGWNPPSLLIKIHLCIQQWLTGCAPSMGVSVGNDLDLCLLS